MDKGKTAPCDQEAAMRAKSRSAKVVDVVEVVTTTGNGTSENPYRIIKEYWSKGGELLAVNDPKN